MSEPKDNGEHQILIIDDEPELADVIKEVLRDEGYNVTSTTDSTKALTMIQDNAYDLVITDLKMPKVDGIQVMETVRNQARETDVVVVTGYGSLDTAVSALRQNVYDYILKPFNIEDIQSTVRRVFEKRSLVRRNEELQQRVTDNLDQLTTLYEISKFINSSENRSEVLQYASEALAVSIGLEKFCIMMDDNDDNHYQIFSSVGLDDETVRQFTVEGGVGAIGSALKISEVQMLEGFEDDPAFSAGISAPDRENVWKLCLAPLKVEEQTFGFVLVFDVLEQDEESTQKLQLLSVLTTQLSPILKLFLQREAFEKFGKDPLLSLKREMNSIVDRAAAYRGGLILMVLKLYMKKTTGEPPPMLHIHERVKELLLQKISGIDSVIVLGLDSFVIILQGRSRGEAEVFGADLKKTVEAELSADTGGDQCMLDYGSSLYPHDGVEPEDLISIAQQNIWKRIKTG